MFGMNYRYLTAVMALGLGLFAGHSAQAETITLEPHSNWTLDYGDDSCALRRDFGGAESPVFLEMRQYSPDSSMQMLVASAHHTRRRNSSDYRRQRTRQIRFLPDEEGRSADGFYINFPDDIGGITFTATLRTAEYLPSAEVPRPEWPDAARDEREAQVYAIEIANVFRDDLILQTGRLHAPMEAMRTCLDELLTHWGVDVEAHRTLTRKAVPLNMVEWAREVQEVYPRSMLNGREQASLRIRLDVSPEGRATGCHMQTRLGEEEFEHTACRILMANARYEPALDAQGQPIASYHVLQVVYQIG